MDTPQMVLPMVTAVLAAALGVVVPLEGMEGAMALTVKATSSLL